jgi:predicted alpha/beta superfamily hydrolase
MGEPVSSEIRVEKNWTRRACLMAMGGALLPMPTFAQPLPKAQLGRLERLPLLPSRHVEPRPIDVWLPAAYDGQRPHAVLYMHDGQMLFDASTTWNKQAWDVDTTAQPMINRGALRDFIVVGIHNNGQKRFAEYYPQKFMAHLPATAREGLTQRGLEGKAMSDAYLQYLVEEVKPAIDARYATRRGRADTVIMGSSMGGLISIYALLEYPRVFSAAAALSTHWITLFEDNDVFPAAAVAYLQAQLPRVPDIRLYMDRGTTELDGHYARAQDRIDAVFKALQLAPPQVVSRVFEGTGHNEKAWADRLATPLTFLLGR